MKKVSLKKKQHIANDNDLKNYPILKPDCTIDTAVFAELKKKNPAMSYSLSAKNSPDGMVEFTVPDGLGLKEFKVWNKDGQLTQINVARKISEMGRNDVITKTVTNTYAFDCASGHCKPKFGMEHSQSSNMAMYGNPTFDSQLFDVGLCKKLKEFFANNPKAAACVGDFEKKSAELLKDYQSVRVTYPVSNASGMGAYPNPVVFGGSLFNEPLATRPNERIEEYFKKNPIASEKRSNPISDSKLALAMSLNSDCANDKRLTSTINSPSSESTMQKKEKSAVR